MLEQSVGEWLESIGLQQYESKLLLNGFDDVRFLVSCWWDLRALRNTSAGPRLVAGPLCPLQSRPGFCSPAEGSGGCVGS